MQAHLWIWVNALLITRILLWYLTSASTFAASQVMWYHSQKNIHICSLVSE